MLIASWQLLNQQLGPNLRLSRYRLNIIYLALLLDCNLHHSLWDGKYFDPFVHSATQIPNFLLTPKPFDQVIFVHNLTFRLLNKTFDHPYNQVPGGSPWWNN